MSEFHLATLWLWFSVTVLLANAYPFRDVSLRAGLQRPFGRRIKYGGASIADLDGDGYPDLLFVHHDQRSLQVYFNLGDGRFKLSKYTLWLDSHALNPIRLTPFQRRMHFFVSEGGAYGKNLKPPRVLRITDNRNVIIEDTKQSPELQASKGRGRTTLFLSLSTDKRKRVRPDMISINADGNRNKEKKSPNYFAFQVYNDGTLHRRGLRHLRGGRVFQYMTSAYGGVTDINNDGTMEVVFLGESSIWKLAADFTLREITAQTFPPVKNRKKWGSRRSTKLLNSATAFAELDYDNDGDWDLFFTQSATRDQEWKSRIVFPRHDILLRNNHKGSNVGEMFTDVSLAAGIPRSGRATDSTGVTVGDFDNDGWVDIFIVQYARTKFSPSGMRLLRNLGNGKFHSISHGFTRPYGVPGDMVTAVDYDLDGRVDLVVSEGDWFDRGKGGFYRIMRNTMLTGNGFLLVRVMNGPKSACTSLHAVVVVTLLDGTKMMRRVGSPSTAVSVSYVETLHFGLGKHLDVDSVAVTWVDGTVRVREGVRANSTVVFGVGS